MVSLANLAFVDTWQVRRSLWGWGFVGVGGVRSVGCQARRFITNRRRSIMAVGQWITTAVLPGTARAQRTVRPQRQEAQGASKQASAWPPARWQFSEVAMPSHLWPPRPVVEWGGHLLVFRHFGDQVSHGGEGGRRDDLRLERGLCARVRVAQVVDGDRGHVSRAEAAAQPPGHPNELMDQLSVGLENQHLRMRYDGVCGAAAEATKRQNQTPPAPARSSSQEQRQAERPAAASSTRPGLLVAAACAPQIPGLLVSPGPTGEMQARCVAAAPPGADLAMGNTPGTVLLLVNKSRA